jgi:hypothetical protein
MERYTRFYLLTFAAALPLAVPACRAQVTDVTLVSDAGGPTSASDDGGASDASAAAGTCATIADCPLPPSACVLATCERGACGTTLVARGTFLTRNVPADCHAMMCDGAGGIVDAVDISNAPAASACATPTCKSDGAVAATFAAAGTACTSPVGGQKCDGAGQCVQCLATADCSAGAACVKGQCVWSCIDGMKDGTETDVDCGGAACAPCANGKACTQGVDCGSSTCDAASHVCVDASCMDMKQNGTETDVDCGGSCAPCANGSMCRVASDCASRICDGLHLRCVANACNDDVQNGTETDVDCGGGSCPACADLKRCLQGADCTSGRCDAKRNMCLPASCADSVRDGTETDVDCGGLCIGCGFGKRCGASSDCLSNACDGITSTCDWNPCADHRQDNQESDVDCGGPVCGPCVVGKKCSSNGDCAPGHLCNATHVCQ